MHIYHFMTIGYIFGDEVENMITESRVLSLYLQLHRTLSAHGYSGEHLAALPSRELRASLVGQAQQSGLHLSNRNKLSFNAYTAKICFSMCSSIEFGKHNFVSTARMIMHAKLASFLSAHNADHYPIPVCSRCLFT